MVTQVFFPWISGIEYVESREDDRIVFCNQKLKVSEALAQGSYFGWLPGKFAVSYPDYPSSGFTSNCLGCTTEAITRDSMWPAKIKAANTIASTCKTNTT